MSVSPSTSIRLDASPSPAAVPPRNAALGQWFTPVWAAGELIDLYFSDLPDGATYCDPTCGDGAFLKACPSRLQAIGCEIDPVMAQQAREQSGKLVITGDFPQAEISGPVDAFIGNPPFALRTFERILDRVRLMLPEGGRAGFILSSHFIQTPSSVLRFNTHFALKADHLPRTLFPRLSKPLVFAVFTKDTQRRLIGFPLYAETQHILGLDEAYKQIMKHSRSVWVECIARALIRLGGKATLRAIYNELATRRPTANQWWKAKIRQTLRQYFRQVEPATYALPALSAT